MLYEDQADGFDKRAGVPPETGEAIADALAAIAHPATGDTWMEIGAGTGLLSLPILRLPIRYVGFDRSPAMLDRFREKVGEAGIETIVSPQLVVADGNERWPVEDGSTALIFSARALHHIEPDHVVAETLRVIRPEGGWLVVGRVRRPKDSVKQTLRRHMRDILDREGHPGRSNEARAGRIFAELERIGGHLLPPIVAARWSTEHTPGGSIAAWEGKEGLAGIDIPAELKGRVLAETRSWALERYGDLDRPLDQEEFFELLAVELPAVTARPA